MTNAEWCIKNGYRIDSLYFSGSQICGRKPGEIIGDRLDMVQKDSGKPEDRQLLCWLAKEHDAHILTSSEKRYLQQVIRPWRDQVRCIHKEHIASDCAEIAIDADDIGIKSYTEVDLPVFVANSMYKGMEFERRYTLKELEL